MKKENVKVFYLPYILSDSNGSEPTKAHEGDAGVDLCATEDVELYIGDTVAVDTGLIFAIPFNYCGLVLPRSSMGKRGIIIPNSPGLIDSGYRGEVKVLLLNLSNKIYKVKKGDKIAQLVIVQHERVTPQKVDELPPSFDDRGVGGFGSSGK